MSNVNDYSRLNCVGESREHNVYFYATGGSSVIVANRYGDIITSVTVYPNWGGYDEAALIAAYLKVAK